MTPHFSTPSAARTVSMSPTSRLVVFARSRSSHTERPHPRWSNVTRWKLSGSKSRGASGGVPPPGPPCKYTTVGQPAPRPAYSHT
eukprot:1049547-Prymnesium_polylepis.1